MYRHHYSISALICLLFLIVGFQHVSAQSQLAQDTYAIFEASLPELPWPRRRFPRDTPHGARHTH